MKRLISCGFNMDIACVELKFSDGSSDRQLHDFGAACAEHGDNHAGYGI